METPTSCSGKPHHDAVVLPNGLTVLACSFPADDYGSEPVPDFGLYLDDRWQPPWEHAHLDWPDFGLPSDPATMDAALDDLLRRVRQGQTVAIGCLGGHGRTGTALAVLAVKARVTQDAVGWVRATYCDKAAETDEQETFVRAYQDPGA